jgi:predicted regulator of Ras-like GTPase activity (Roadblock/LC7/MglB family)
LVIDKGGFIVATQGISGLYDTTTLAALAAASYTANQAIASLISEPNFSSIYQQGETSSMLVMNVDEHCLLVVVFNARHSVGAVKYYACSTIRLIAAQFQRARARDPEKGMDLSLLNIADTSGLFQRKDPV